MPPIIICEILCSLRMIPYFYSNQRIFICRRYLTTEEKRCGVSKEKKRWSRSQRLCFWVDWWPQKPFHTLPHLQMNHDKTVILCSLRPHTLNCSFPSRRVHFSPHMIKPEWHVQSEPGSPCSLRSGKAVSQACPSTPKVQDFSSLVPSLQPEVRGTRRLH